MRSGPETPCAAEPAPPAGPRRARRLLALAAAALAAPLSGCYLAHVSLHQLSILCGRTPIEAVIAADDLDAGERHKLELVLAVRRFAIDRIGLTETGSYTTFYDAGDAPSVAWNLSAAAPDALAPCVWIFPIVGAVPYLGFFDRGYAVAEAVALRERDLDVLVLPVPAYSTLGWFDDPLFSPMLRYDEATIAEIVVHELAHATVFVSSDADFNETLATFVGTAGAEAFFLARGGPDDPGLAGVREDAADDERVADALRELRGELQRIYESTGRRSTKLALKAAAFERFRRHLEEDVLPAPGDAAPAPARARTRQLNNAYVLAFERYHGDLDAFEALHAQHGGDLRATVDALRALAEEEDPRAALAERVAAATAAPPGGPP